MDSRHELEVGFPFSLDTRGRLASPDFDRHVRQLIELVLFTSPGERVNRPEFGCGLLELLFGPDSGQVASAAEFLVQGSLQEWLGDLIEVHNVDISTINTVLQIRIEYLLLTERSTRVAIFEPQESAWNP